MALGASKIQNFGSGAATASARPATGGRSSATGEQAAIEMADFNTQIGVGDHGLYDDQANIDVNARRRGKAGFGNNSFLNRMANAFHAISEVNDNGTSAPPIFLHDVMRGVMLYEHSQRVILGEARPGSTYNHLF